MDLCLPTFDIYQGTVAPNCILRATQTLNILIFFQKKVLPDARSESHLVRRNIVSTGQSVKNRI